MPIIVAVTGSPGSGKTTVASAVAAELGVPLVSRDHFKIGIGLSSARADGAGGVEYDADFAVAGGSYSAAAEQAMVGVAELLLAHNVSFVIESSLLPTAAMARLIELGARVISVHVSASTATISASLQARASSGAPPALQLLDQHQNGQMRPELFQPVVGALTTICLDTTVSEPPDTRAVRAAVHGALT